MDGSDVALDTRREAAAFHARVYAEMSPATRLQTALEMSVMARELTMAGLRRRNPHLGEDELRVRLIELCYGSAEAR